MKPIVDKLSILNQYCAFNYWVMTSFIHWHPKSNDVHEHASPLVCYKGSLSLSLSPRLNFSGTSPYTWEKLKSCNSCPWVSQVFLYILKEHLRIFFFRFLSLKMQFQCRYWSPNFWTWKKEHACALSTNPLHQAQSICYKWSTSNIISFQVTNKMKMKFNVGNKVQKYCSCCNSSYLFALEQFQNPKQQTHLKMQLSPTKQQCLNPEAISGGSG